MRVLEDILNSSELDPLLMEEERKGSSTEQKSGSKVLEDDENQEDDDNTNSNTNTQVAAAIADSLESKSITRSYVGKRGNSPRRGTSNSPMKINDRRNVEYKSAFMEKARECRGLEIEVMELKRVLLQTERKLCDMRDEKQRVEVNHA